MLTSTGDGMRIEAEEYGENTIAAMSELPDLTQIAPTLKAEILAGDGLKRAATILLQSLQEAISLREESRVELAIK